MKSLFDPEIFDGVEIFNQKIFEEFCLKYPQLSKSYLKVGVSPYLRKEYEEIFGRFSSVFGVKGFREEIRQKDEKFTQRIWELEIFHFLQNSFGNLSRHSQGYDFTLITKYQVINIECVAPEAGDNTNPRKIPRINHSTGKVQMAPGDINERIVLRITNSLNQKLRHKNQSPQLGNPYIIAINTANLDWDFGDPRGIYQLLFALRYPKSNNPERWWNENGAELGYFATDKFAQLSAVIFSNYHPNEYRRGNPDNKKNISYS